MAKAAIAVKKDSTTGEIVSPSVTMVGSGTSVMAPIAVKWCETIATVSKTVATTRVTAVVPTHGNHKRQAANTLPNATEANTIPGDQTMRAGSSSAIIPV